MKLCPKETFKRLYFLTYQKPIKKRFQNNHDIFFQKYLKARRSCISFSLKLHSKNTYKQSRFFAIEIALKKVRRSDVVFSPIDTTSKSTSEWRGNLSIFSFRCIDIILSISHSIVIFYFYTWMKILPVTCLISIIFKW